MMRLARRILISALAMMWGGAVSAAPEAVTFSLVSSVGSGGAFPSSSTYVPPLPLEGSGTIDEVAGTYDLTLPDFTIVIDVVLGGAPDPDDAQLDISGWGQAGTFAVGGAMTTSTATGAVACTVLDAAIGSFVCALIDPSVAAWPPTGASGDFGAPGATIDVGANTIVVTEAFDANGGQVQTTYTYAPAPEAVPTLSEWGMMTLGLLVLTAGIVAILRREKSPAA
ncbi:MAG: IPTL-CTERM sorting domain-containing protein [Myxococcales bacterium]